MKGKLGFYAQYDKVSGCLIRTAIKKDMDIHKSNKDSISATWNLVTSDISMIDEIDVPKENPHFDDNAFKESHPDYFCCEICFDYFKKNEMSYINGIDGSGINVCNECS